MHVMRIPGTTTYRRAAFGLAAFGVVALHAAAPRTLAGQEPAAYAFVGVNVVPMDGERVLEDQTVVVRGPRIAAVGPRASTPVPDDARTIDGRGRWLMPGLAEMHAHVPPVPRGSDAWPDREALDDILFLYLANGITTIRGMLGATYQLELRDLIERGEVLGPTFYVGAPSINGSSAPDPETADSLVRAHAAAGYDLQKIHPGVSLETWDRMARTAHEVGLTFGGHVPQAVGLRHAVETGMSTVDHIDGVIQVVTSAPAGAPPAEVFSSIDEERLREVADLLVAHDVYVVPTEYLWENIFGVFDPEEMARLPEMRYVSPGQREAWIRQKQRQPPQTPEAAAAVARARRHFIDVFEERGVKLLMGTDSPQMFNVPGFALHREIRVMREAGLTPYEVLVSGTVNVASYVRDHLKKDGRFGTVAAGQRADLVLLDGNPLESLDHLAEREGVMVRGRWLDGEAIRARLERIAAKHATP